MSHLLRFKSRTRELQPFMACLILISMILTACGGTSTQAPAATEAPATEGPATEASTEQNSPGSAVSLRLWYSGTQDELAFLQKQVSAFQQKYPQVVVEINFFPPDVFVNALATAIAAGDPPDLATLSLNNLVELQRAGTLSPVDLGKIDLPEDFRKDALAGGKIDADQYGLPLRQYGCAPVFQYLAILEGTKYPDESLLFINFLTAPEQEEQAFAEQLWIPTRQSVYSGKTIACPAVELIPQSSSEILTSITVVKERAKVLEPVLSGAKLDAYEAITVIENEQVQGTFAVPTMGVVDETGYLIIGGVFIDQAKDVRQPGGYMLPQGDYVLKCDEKGTCFFVAPDKKSYEVIPEVFEELSVPITKPVVAVEVGSKKTCGYVRNPLTGKTYYICITIG